LKSVPTNAQLTITLLRIGEANDAPLPPPPFSGPPPPNVAHPNAGQNLEHLGRFILWMFQSRPLIDPEGASDGEISAAINPDSDPVTTGADVKPKKKAHGRHILAAFKSGTKAGVEAVLGT
jgi:hypothetical protein